ncbi:hypothetical protein D3C76_1558540 [compost metagenome]
MQHAANAKHIAVNRRQRRGDHHKVKDARRHGNAHMLESQHERTAVGTHLIPRVDRHNDKQRTDVEHQDTPRYRVDGLGNGGFRVLGFTGSDTDNLDTAVGEHHQL